MLLLVGCSVTVAALGAVAAAGAPATAGRGGRTVSSQVTAELADSLATLHRVLPAAGDAAPSSKQLEQVLAAGERVRAADLLMRAHFGTIRERLEEIEVGSEIFDRLAAAETSYRDAMDELLGAVPPTAGKAVHGELAVLGERLAARLATPPPPILRGGVLPYRPAGLAPRAPRTEPAVVPSYLNPPAAIWCPTFHKSSKFNRLVG
ncbi:MAG: hypothetical protein GY838_05315 [bacterium]|nr:hypothetical protein [bacterium]